MYNEGWIFENIWSYYDVNYPDRIDTLRGPSDWTRDDLLDLDITLDDSNIAYCFDTDYYSNYYGYEIGDWKQLTKYDGKGTTDSYVRTVVFKSDYFNEILEQTITFEFSTQNLTWGAHWDEVSRVELNEGILGTWKGSGWEFRITSYTEDTCYVEYCSYGSTEVTPGALQVGELNGNWVYLTWTDNEEHTFNKGHTALEGLCIRGNSLIGKKINLSVVDSSVVLKDRYLEKVTQ